MLGSLGALGHYALAALGGSALMLVIGQVTKHFGRCIALCDPSFAAISGALVGVVALRMIRTREG